VLRSRSDEVTLSEDEALAVKRLLDNAPLAAGELGVPLARRLLLAGVAVVA
jgi:hypothetical protein